ARQSKLGAQADTGAVNRRHRWLLHLLEQVRRLDADMAERPQGVRLPRKPPELDDVDPRAERQAVPAKHHRMDVRGIGGLAGGVAKRTDQRGVDRVSLLRPIENQVSDVAVVRHAYEIVHLLRS